MIHDRARHVPHGMPAAAFQDNAFVDPSIHRAVQELGAGTPEDNTVEREGARHDVPLQIQDGSVLYRDSSAPKKPEQSKSCFSSNRPPGPRTAPH